MSADEARRRVRRIVLDEARFGDLVAGRVVSFEGGYPEVQLILSDIGWAAMLRAVLNAMAPLSPPPRKEPL